jgi:hypothetical protein
LYQDHKNDEAVEAYSKAIDLDPQNARAFALRAWAFSRKRDNALSILRSQPLTRIAVSVTAKRKNTIWRSPITRKRLKSIRNWPSPILIAA